MTNLYFILSCVHSIDFDSRNPNALFFVLRCVCTASGCMNICVCVVRVHLIYSLFHWSHLAPVVYCEWCPLLPDTEDSLSNSDLLAPKSTVVSATDLRIDCVTNQLYSFIPLPQVILCSRLWRSVGFCRFRTERFSTDWSGGFEHSDNDIPLVGLKHLLILAHIPYLKRHNQTESFTNFTRILPEKRH